MAGSRLITALVLMAVTSARADAVRTTQGALVGLSALDGVRAFEGIPFARAPVGDLRWRPPAPPLAWEGVRAADHFGPRPMQLRLWGDMRFRSNSMSEDCLTLNVWTPTGATAESRLPVMVYFYGGGFAGGAADEYRYDGAAMARRGMVVVTANYRLGVFGFLAHPELTAESPEHACGNYGLMDQVAALAWVRTNIGPFGGDAGHVTIAGESAGAFSVAYLMASARPRGMFTAAIGQSGGVLRADATLGLAEAERDGEQFATAAGARSLAELRAMPAEKVLLATRRASKVPYWSAGIVDGSFLTEPAAVTFAAGRQARVPLMVGRTNGESGYRPVVKRGRPTTAAYVAAVRTLYGPDAEQVLDAYPPGTTDLSARDAAAALGGDRTIGTATWRWIDLALRTGGSPVYAFSFDHPRPRPRSAVHATTTTAPAKAADPNGEREDATLPSPGAPHASDIEYVLGNLATNPVYAWTADDARASDVSLSYFAAFVKTTDPASPGLPAWPAAVAGDVRTMHLDATPHVEPEAGRRRHELLDRLPATRPVG